MTIPIIKELPRLGRAGSRIAGLHLSSDAEGTDLGGVAARRFRFCRVLGTVGAILVALAGLGSGALPVVNNAYAQLSIGAFMGRMLQTSSSLTLLGVGLIVTAWVFMAGYVGAKTISVGDIVKVFAAWAVPIALTAPLFTQDIYSYIAQGAIVASGFDPYSAGPVALLGSDHLLARSVPFIWAESPAPYGPVALGISSAIYHLLGDSIIGAIYAHRLVNIVGLVAVGWSIMRLARRCHVRETTALWLSVINPLTLLHLVGGIHNEAILLGLVMVGMELGLTGVERITLRHDGFAFGLITLGAFLICCAGMVKVTGFIGLGFLGMSAAMAIRIRTGRSLAAIALATGWMVTVLIASILIVSVSTGIPLGWITGQGGAASIRSWMSITTDIGVISGSIGSALGLGDHTEAILTVTRVTGLIIAVAWTVRMLFAVAQGTIHALGGMGVSTFVLVVLFPVVHPWYMLWAIIPLAGWANRPLFRMAAMIYSAMMSFFVLPRGLALPSTTVITIYGGALALALVIAGVAWWVVRQSRVRALD